jgi:hypothetical protein
MLMRAPAAALLDQPLSGEQVARRADGRPGPLDDLGMPRREPVEQLAGAPVRVRAPRPKQQVRDRLVDAVRTVVGAWLRSRRPRRPSS